MKAEADLGFTLSWLHDVEKEHIQGRTSAEKFSESVGRGD